ncbi:MAG: serine/threonine protein kinase, partial [Kiritimatiellae bacterium]|nr:serine/threonine protein kinase [Kiritimatiellia bacterium]
MSDSAENAPAPENQISMETLEEMKCPACGAQIDVRGLAAFSKIECPGCHAEARVPARFSHFTLLRRLGSGGMGTAFLGEDEALGRKVAVKVMQKALGDDEKAFETFKNEAQNAARLNHPHVAQIYSFGKEGDNPFLEMELVPGGDLGTFIADKTVLDPAFVLRVGMEIAEGLEAAEKVGLFHGDVKPDNILFDENMSAKLVDFGIASRASQGQMEELWGTPYYIAPEKVQKKMNSARSDIYSLGATLYHAITGQPPYDGEDAVAVIKARFKGPPPPVEKIRPDVEPEVSRIVTRMMYNDLFMRYPNYKSVIGDIEKYLSTVKDIRKQGPKGASATIRAKLAGTGAVKPEAATGAAEAASGSGKKKFVLSKGHMSAAAPAESGGGGASGGSHVVLKGHGGATLSAAAPAHGKLEPELD